MIQRKYIAIFLLLFNLIGIAGLHRLYVGKTKTGILYLLTFGIFGIGSLYDLILLLQDKFTDKNNIPLKSKEIVNAKTYTPDINTNGAGVSTEVNNKRLEDLNAEVAETQEESDTINEQEVGTIVPETAMSENNNSSITVTNPPQVVNNMFLKYHYDDVGIYTTIDDLDGIPIGKWIDIRQEPENQYDPNAVQISFEGKQLGYIYKGTHQEMCNKYLSKDNIDVIGKITKIDRIEHKIYIYLAFYNEITKDMIENTFNVTVSESKYYENYISISDGIEVDISYDFENDKFTIDDWGAVPKSAKGFFDEIQGSFEYISYIEKVTENESGSYKVKINTIRN